jgi:hypothetical protein
MCQSQWPKYMQLCMRYTNQRAIKQEAAGTWRSQRKFVRCGTAAQTWNEAIRTVPLSGVVTESRKTAQMGDVTIRSPLADADVELYRMCKRCPQPEACPVRPSLVSAQYSLRRVIAALQMTQRSDMRAMRSNGEWEDIDKTPQSVPFSRPCSGSFAQYTPLNAM